jgi:acetyl-CoA decarbonylase/synthase complex subunit epsilon
MAVAIPWQTANIVGPKNALLLTPEHCARLLKTAKRPLIVVGAHATKPSVGLPDLAEYVLRLAEVVKAQVAASPTVESQFTKQDKTQVFGLGLEDLTNRLKDKEWKGFDGRGTYDYVLLVGGVYYFESQMLATLKHFAPHIRTVSLDRFYQPNASFSFPSMDVDKWKDGLSMMIKELGGKD